MSFWVAFHKDVSKAQSRTSLFPRTSEKRRRSFIFEFWKQFCKNGTELRIPKPNSYAEYCFLVTARSLFGTLKRDLATKEKAAFGKLGIRESQYHCIVESKRRTVHSQFVKRCIGYQTWLCWLAIACHLFRRTLSETANSTGSLKATTLNPPTTW